MHDPSEIIIMSKVNYIYLFITILMNGVGIDCPCLLNGIHKHSINKPDFLPIHAPGNGLRKLFGVFRDESKGFTPSMCWLNTFSAMSSVSVKIENFRHILMSSLTDNQFFGLSITL